MWLKPRIFLNRIFDRLKTGVLTMAVFLVQHGLSLSREQDPERGLSEAGIADVKRIAEVAKSYGITVASIFHSGKMRARQTAEIFASALHPEGGVAEMTGLNPLDDVQAFSKNLSFQDNHMFVGHLPFMEKLAAFLITRDLKHPVFQFQNGGIVCLDQYGDQGGWVVKWTLMPHIH
jgi:phosphohistidine phosphatase